MLKRIAVILVFGLLTVYQTPAFADPAVISVSASAIHGSAITVGGTNFGTKSPAAPLAWDNCEGRTLNDPDAVVSFGYVDVWPRGPNCPDAYRLNYRAHPYTHPYAGAQPMPGAHSRSENYMASGAYQDPINAARNITIGISSPSSSNVWYAFWYIRADGNTWPVSPGTSPNYKNWNFESQDDYHGGSHFYEGCTSCQHNRIDPMGFLVNVYIDGEYHADVDAPNEINQWIHHEVLYRNNDQLLKVTKSDNSNLPVKMHDRSASGPAVGWNPKALFIGGFNRHDQSAPGGYTHPGMWRYFDDIYVDNTWSRVMLGDNPDYDSCTIIEPQIPSAWSSTSITVTVNLGALTGQLAYLYVFDSDNNSNVTGYSTPIVCESYPDPPQNLRIVE